MKAKARRKSPEWREFEKLVALLEIHLSSNGATIKSPDYILDRSTGEMREVDASIRYQFNSNSILITLECRKRSTKQDVQWIEQLVCKRDDIDASTTIAVSSSGFSEPAIKKARFHGIETRLLHEISGEAISEWAKQINIMLFRGSFGLGNLRVLFKGFSYDKQPELHPDIKAEYAKGDVEYKFIRHIEDDTLISIADLLREVEMKGDTRVDNQTKQYITIRVPPKSKVIVPYKSQFPSLFEDIPVGEKPVTKIYTWKFEPNEATIETKHGAMEIEYLGVELNIILRAYPSNVGRLLSYENDRGPIVNVEERTIELNEDVPIIKAVISGNMDNNN